VNVIGHFEISPAIVPFIEANMCAPTPSARRAAVLLAGRDPQRQHPDRRHQRSVVLHQQRGNFGAVNREGVRLDNPFLSQQARDL
jgi:hypothetical protein